MNELNKNEIFLIEEYKSAVELTFQMDSLRNKLTSFFISFAGVATAGFILAIKRNDINISNLSELISVIMILVAIIGHLFICVLAKIRKVQLEHFAIINNIRAHFLKEDFKLWNVVQLSGKTLPKAGFFSGTYFWQLVIQLVNAFILFLGVLLLIDSLSGIFSVCSLIIFLFTFIGSLIIQHILYFALAKPSPMENYSEENKPN